MISLTPASATAYKQVNLLSIHGGPRVGKTHQSVELTAGQVIGAIVNDPNSLPVLKKRGEELEKRGEKMIVIPHDTKGPITFHLDQSDAIMKDPAVCKKYYQKQVERLFALCDELLPQIDGLIVDNDSDLQRMFDFAHFGGVGRPKISDIGPRNRQLQRFYSMFLSAGVHTTLIHMSENKWHSKVELDNQGKEKTTFNVIGKEADIFEKSAYKFNGMFELIRVESHTFNETKASIAPAIKWYADQGVKFRQMKSNDILLRCLNSTGGVEFNPNECVWLSQPSSPKDLEYPDSITMDNVLGRLYPNIDLDYWRQTR